MTLYVRSKGADTANSYGYARESRPKQPTRLPPSLRNARNARNARNVQPSSCWAQAQ